ncbi:hypothetical protein [Nonomuraea aurantiaca]|jgi:hypothetical protein|uniref:hypothetical protein n=1 Tax=Nonomuraea aurantiaca TaxID=2878562 RepID=UPI001CD9975B|nr:hypothetical protein [Nonomuraea aurantiaca]MCA2221027.1 hypothetical protein [Nonomuraea aurantiaca]
MPTPDDGGERDDTRDGLGLPRDQRNGVESGEDGRVYEVQLDPRNTEEEYTDYLQTYGHGGYPPTAGPRVSETTRDELLTKYHVDPGGAKKEMFIKIADFVDPETGKPRPDSPVEKLRADLDRLRGLGGTPGLEVLVSRSTLTERDLGTWQAATDLRLTTDKAQTSLKSAVTQLCSVYEAILETLDQTVKAAMDADQAVAQGLRGTAT